MHRLSRDETVLVMDYCMLCRTLYGLEVTRDNRFYITDY
jgi:hypothetical protein